MNELSLKSLNASKLNKDIFENHEVEVTNSLSNKVDKISGKGLSTNDYTVEDKNKLNNTKQAIVGQANFASGSKYIQIELGRTMPNTNYTVSISPTSATNGMLGEVWVIKSTTYIRVYNSGSHTGPFDYIILY